MINPDESASEYLKHLDRYNNIEDINAILSKNSSMFGRSYEMYYVDSEGEIKIVVMDPTESFMIYDDTIEKNPLFFVYEYADADDHRNGSIYSKTQKRSFTDNGGLHWTSEWETHGFKYVPATEYILNDEKIGIYECELPAINAYNKALSEKANDVDYFADAYLKVIGPRVDEEDTTHIRENRIINFETDEPTGTQVDFLSKPNADETQENLINRLERQIFHISMVADINDENFGNASGIAMQYRILCMENMAQVKKRKFIASFQNRYRTILSNAVVTTGGVKEDAWIDNEYIFNFNLPKNVKEEAEVAQDLDGMVSRETQLSILSLVRDPKEEIRKIKEEEEEDRSMINNKLFGGDGHQEEELNE